LSSALSLGNECHGDTYGPELVDERDLRSRGRTSSSLNTYTHTREKLHRDIHFFSGKGTDSAWLSLST